MSKFPLIGKNVLVVYGNQKTHYETLYISDGILLSYDVFKNQKKESFVSVKLSLNNVEQKIDGVLLITLYSKQLQDVNAEKLKAEKDFLLQQEQSNNEVKTSKMPNQCLLSVKDIQIYLQSIDSLSKGVISIYLLDKDSNVNEYTDPGKFFKLLSLNVVLMQASIQSLWLDKTKSRTSKPEIKEIQNVFSIFNLNDLNLQLAGKKYKKYTKKYKKYKKHTKKHTKKYTKKYTKKR